MWEKRGGQVRHVGAEQVVRHDAGRVLEPEGGELGEYFALVGNAGAEDVVERRDAIGRDEQQPVSEVEEVTNLAVAIGSGPVEACIEEWSSRRHGGLGRKGGILSARGDDRNRTQGDRP